MKVIIMYCKVLCTIQKCNVSPAAALDRTGTSGVSVLSKIDMLNISLFCILTFLPCRWWLQSWCCTSSTRLWRQKWRDLWTPRWRTTTQRRIMVHPTHYTLHTTHYTLHSPSSTGMSWSCVCVHLTGQWPVRWSPAGRETPERENRSSWSSNRGRTWLKSDVIYASKELFLNMAPALAGLWS